MGLSERTGPATGREEWRAHYMVPVAAALGYATSVIHIYGLGPFIEPVASAFGWSRAKVTAGLTIATLVQAVGGVFIGIAVDRFGPRRFGIVGIPLIAAAFALIGTATGGTANWIMLWGLIALAALPVQASVWTSAVASRFNASRGMALAVTLCGASVAAAVFPLLGAFLVERAGWRLAMAVMAAVWIAVSYPPILLFFRGAYDRGGKQNESGPRVPHDLPGATIRQALKSTIYARLFVASLLFTFTIIAMVVHFVPILTDRGADGVTAAAIASFIGLFSIAGRLGTGFMLDRFQAPVVGAAVFLLPVAGALILLLAGNSYAVLALAAGLIGLTLGAEIDVIVFLTTRFFGLRNFGALYGGLLAALSIGTAVGPLVAAAVFDDTGNYDLFLWGTTGFMLASSLALYSLPRLVPEWPD